MEQTSKLTTLLRNSLAVLAGVLWMIPSVLHAQQLQFTYDAAGNQTARVWICVGCPSAEAEGIARERVIPETAIRYRTDPDSKELYLSWPEGEKGRLKKFTVTDRSGRTVYRKSVGKSLKNVGLSFAGLSPGDYTLHAYSDTGLAASVPLIRQ